MIDWNSLVFGTIADISLGKYQFLLATQKNHIPVFIKEETLLFFYLPVVFFLNYISTVKVSMEFILFCLILAVVEGSVLNPNNEN